MFLEAWRAILCRFRRPAISRGLRR